MSGVPAVVSIAGSDSSGGAGIQADLRAFALHGVYGTAVVTAVTAQGGSGVTVVASLPAAGVAAQLAACGNPSAAKTGMLADAAIVGAVVAWRKSRPDLPLVVDPVAAASSGARLVDAAGWMALRRDLIPRATLVTPNLAEAALLLESEVRPTRPARAAAARQLADHFGTSVLLKGGHAGDAADCLAEPGGAVVWFEGERIRGGPWRGTGCLLSAAIAARLAYGNDLHGAIGGAKLWLADALRNADGPWPVPWPRGPNAARELS